MGLYCISYRSRPPQVPQEACAARRKALEWEAAHGMGGAVALRTSD